MFPGEGFISNPERDRFRARRIVPHQLDEAIRRLLSRRAAIDQRLLHPAQFGEFRKNRASAQAPQSDPTACPIAGFAEIPENPSDPPHFKPTQNCDKRRRRRGWSCPPRPLQETSPGWLPTTWRIQSRFSAARIPAAASEIADRAAAICSRRILTCEFWQPRLRTVAPATFG